VKEKEEKTKEELQLVSFKLGKETFAVYVNQVREIGRVEEITQVPNMPEFIEGVMDLRGQITTVIDLRRRFGIKETSERTEDSRIIVAEIDNNQMGIIVDSVQDVIRVSPEVISPPPEVVSRRVDSKFLKGVCRQQDELIMLLDLNNLFSDEEKEGMQKIQAEEPIKEELKSEV
jgi:purine-binding chemotaxis protein CheW